MCGSSALSVATGPWIAGEPAFPDGGVAAAAAFTAGGIGALSFELVPPARSRSGPVEVGAAVLRHVAFEDGGSDDHDEGPLSLS